MANEICYTTVLGNKPGERIGLVKIDVDGYYLCEGYDYSGDSLETVRERVADLNERMGIPDDVALSMTCGSMFGWHVPAAARAHEFWQNEERQKKTV